LILEFKPVKLLFKPFGSLKQTITVFPLGSLNVVWVALPQGKNLPVASVSLGPAVNSHIVQPTLKSTVDTAGEDSVVVVDTGCTSEP